MTHTSLSLSDKIKSPSEMAKLTANLRAQGLVLVHCHGVFDLMHPGHIIHLEAARQEGDVLIVSLPRDEFVNKGPGRPVFNQDLRTASLAALQCVDYVVISEQPNAGELIRLLKPDVFAKGGKRIDYEQENTNNLHDEEQAVLAVGGRLKFTDSQILSSSNLINTYFKIFPPETEAWLAAFRKQQSAEGIIDYLHKAAGLKVLVVGEAIIDEYIFCDGLGKSSKDPVLALRYRSTETHAGGSLAVANHLASFCEQVGLLTMLGDIERREDFVREALLPNVEPYLLTSKNAPTIHKRRFVDTHTNARTLELYLMEDGAPSPESEAVLQETLAGIIDAYDVVIVTDYGHGMLTPATIDLLCEKARFLAVNTQANAGNRGFNTISKYPRADYVCLTGHEIELETRMRHASLDDLILEVTKLVECPSFTVTKGKDGTVHYANGPSSDKFISVPALAGHVVDRVGAGDAVLALTSLLVAQGAPWEVVGFVGNIAGALMVATLGNRVSVSKAAALQYITALMK